MQVLESFRKSLGTVASDSFTLATMVSNNVCYDSLLVLFVVMLGICADMSTACRASPLKMVTGNLKPRTTVERLGVCNDVKHRL